jgi:hypothetical protein
MRSWRSMASLVLASTFGCNSGTEPTAGSRASPLSSSATATISGRVFRGTGTRNICSVLPPESPLLVLALAENGTFFTSPSTCPVNNFSMAVPPGTYFVRVTLPDTLALGQMPARWLEPVPVTVGEADVVKDLHVRNGSPLEGGARLDGAPTEGLDLTILYADLPFARAAFASSTLSAQWREIFGRSPMILQNGLEYNVFGCLGPYAGIRSINGFPTGPIRFPGRTNRVDCNLETGDALRFTHRATRLKLTSFPGDIGGLSQPFIFPQVGFGYSAQFPLPAGTAPRAGPALFNRQLFLGGLVLGTSANVVISGTELEGFVICAVSPCRALGFDGRARVEWLTGGKAITWEYTDAGSQRPLGIHVRQRSFDGKDGGDYVLYVFRITNRSTSVLDFNPGLIFDFDVPPVIGANIGYTALDGRLMVTTSHNEVGGYLGSVILEPVPAQRNYFFEFTGEEEVARALRGQLGNPTAPVPTDVRGVHGGPPVSLRPGRSTDFWAAIVAGESRAEIAATARKALADARARRAAGNPFGVRGLPLETIRSSDRAVAAARREGSGARKVCKTDCGSTN